MEKKLEELMRRKADLEHALKARGARWVIDQEKPGRFNLTFPGREYITPEVEQIRAEWVRITEEIERLTSPTE